ncbi:acetate kinase [Melghirimyces profundicolus]|uniref:Acetate kinase n=1 Tax=Melghirimyces profundicolus TaxID=1242148 RepID=A0A2T6BV77_9BACL|nr:acetate kinase [Melghirimyces profundicolus]PTX59952.1 acetate kinase [Melghirimyces profundicolus]
MNVLVINCGSSSIKYQLYRMETEEVLSKGLVERIGSDRSIVHHTVNGREPWVETAEILDHRQGLYQVLALLTDPEKGVLEDAGDVDAVGHRVVHGGENFSSAVVIDQEVLRGIRQNVDLAPLHNPPNLSGIDAARHNLPHATHVAVFDTAFHQTMPDYAYMYPLPRVLYQKHRIRRYGFHGTSHQYVAERAAEFLGRPPEELKIISCHIGNGASCTAIEKGRSVDTTMGMTPLEGLMMGTRCGDIDPAIVPYVMGKEELTLAEVNSMMNKHSGLLGVSGISSDMREISEAAFNGDKYARLSLEMYTYRLRKAIGSYAAVMDGVDVLIFTAGVGENASLVREWTCRNLSYLGLELDQEKNADLPKGPQRISTDRSRVNVLVIPTDEELMIARETRRLVQQEEQG